VHSFGYSKIRNVFSEYHFLFRRYCLRRLYREHNYGVKLGLCALLFGQSTYTLLMKPAEDKLGQLSYVYRTD